MTFRSLRILSNSIFPPVSVCLGGGGEGGGNIGFLLDILDHSGVEAVNDLWLARGGRREALREVFVVYRGDGF